MKSELSRFYETDVTCKEILRELIVINQILTNSNNASIVFH